MKLQLEATAAAMEEADIKVLLWKLEHGQL